MSGIRPEAAGDNAVIRRVHSEAFGRPGEADLVEALRAAGRLHGSGAAKGGLRSIRGVVSYRREFDGL